MHAFHLIIFRIYNLIIAMTYWWSDPILEPPALLSHPLLLCVFGPSRKSETKEKPRLKTQLLQPRFKRDNSGSKRTSQVSPERAVSLFERLIVVFVTVDKKAFFAAGSEYTLLSSTFVRMGRQQHLSGLSVAFNDEQGRTIFIKVVALPPDASRGRNKAL